MVEMAGKEYLLKLRKERTPMREEIVRLLAENGTLSFQEIYLEMGGGSITNTVRFHMRETGFWKAW